MNAIQNLSQINLSRIVHHHHGVGISKGKLSTGGGDRSFESGDPASGKIELCENVTAGQSVLEILTRKDP